MSFFWLLIAIYIGYFFVVLSKTKKSDFESNKSQLSKDIILEFIFVPIIIVAIPFVFKILYQLVF